MPMPAHACAPSLRHTIALALLAAVTACGDQTKPAPEMRAEAVPVTVADVGERAASALVTATGTFGSRDEIPLAFKIGGVVARVLVDEGATVQRGQILAALDLREIDAAVSKAQVGVDKAQRDHARLQRLAADSVATLAQLQDATSALDAARADLATARVNREYALITAPETGLVLQRIVTPGSNVSPGMAVLVLGGSRRGRVLRAGLPDRDALRVTVGDQATVHFDALPDRTFTGKVVLVGRSADPRTGTYAVEVSVADADALPSGLVGQLRISVKGTGATAMLPVDALLEADRDSATVYTVAPGPNPVAQAQRIQVARIDGDRAAISGLPADARVITRGAAYVTAGAPVRVVTTATLDSAAPATRVARSPVLTATRGGVQP